MLVSHIQLIPCCVSMLTIIIFQDPEKCQANKLTNDSSSQAELNTGHFQMPYLIVRDGKG